MAQCALVLRSLRLPLSPLSPSVRPRRGVCVRCAQCTAHARAVALLASASLPGSACLHEIDRAENMGRFFQTPTDGSS